MEQDKWREEASHPKRTGQQNGEELLYSII